MNILTSLILQDMTPSLGVTEPGAIALAVSKARSYLTGDLLHVRVELNSGMYKNAFTCGIPKSSHIGAVYAAALGAVVGNPDLELEALVHITPSADRAAEALVRLKKIQVVMTEISPEINIHASVETDSGICSVLIRHAHTNIVSVILNGNVMEKHTDESKAESGAPPEIHRHTLRDLLDYANSVDIAEINSLREAWPYNLSLLLEGLKDPRTEIAHRLYEKNGGALLSHDTLTSAQLLCVGAIEARVLGVGMPAMSITGSGSHGIIAAMPLYAIAKCEDFPEEKLLRATAFSFLVTQYIKEYSGKLSALCGCGIAAGTGMACGAAMLRGLSFEQIVQVLGQMSLGVTGMICDGGNHGCAIKSMTATDAAFRAVDLAAYGVFISPQHGICGVTPEDTMRYIGLIASPGMLETEKTIIGIMKEKSSAFAI